MPAHSPETGAQPEAWCALKPVWTAGPDLLQPGQPAHLSPAWRMFLLGDGSATRNLRLLTGETVQVDILDASDIGSDADGAPAELTAIPGPRLRRQVWLRTESGLRLSYAVSWWQASQIDQYLADPSLPIGISLSQSRREVYRDIRTLFLGHNKALEEAFEMPGPFWGRHYLFWHGGAPFSLIYEVYSPVLSRYLGPTSESSAES
ncbi:chorismate lyase [Leptolyngbya sp. FACHB-261]|nr:chorismate lyase [Leptolyngbya sp. FACHB-261]